MSFDVRIRKRVHGGDRSFDLAIEFSTDARRTVVHGPSGAGKTLTLQAIARARVPEARFDTVVLHQPPREAAAFLATPAPRPDGTTADLRFEVLYLDPYSGTEPKGSNMLNLPIPPYTRGPEVREMIWQDIERHFKAGYRIVDLGQPDGFRGCECEACTKLFDTGSDWSETDPHRVARSILRKVHDGSIVLLHDGLNGDDRADRSVVVAALPEILDGLAARGLRAVRLDELLGGPATQACRTPGSTPVTP